MTMHCHQWDALLDDWRDGRLDGTAAEACRVHARSCSRCADILALFEDDLFDAFTDVDLTGDILARTSGSACGLAREHLGGRPDGDLDETSAGLLAAHLDHCPDCAALEEILSWVMPAVADLGAVEPDPVFTFDVLRATSKARARRRIGALPRLQQRIAAWWETQITRPQFIWEAAFVATVIAVIIFGTPMSPAQRTPRRALEAVQASPAWILEQAGTAVGAAGGLITDLRSDVSRRRDLTAPNRADLRRHTGHLGEAVVDTDLEGTKAELGRMRRDIDELWTTWRTSGRSAEAPDDTTKTDDTPR